MSEKAIKVGDSAPDFELLDQTGSVFRLSDQIGKSIIVLYFYPKDNSPGCSTQACTFRDQFTEFTDNGAKVIGVSSDSVESHKGFIARYDLPFTLLSDENGEVRKLFGIKPSLGLIPGRTTLVIDKKGVVRYIFSSQLNVREHVEKALQEILKIKAESGPDSQDLKINI